MSVLYLSFVTPPAAYATTSNTLNFQARLESSSGAIAPDGTYTIDFHLFNASSSSGSTDTSCSSDANCLWNEEYTSGTAVHVANGYLSVNLGSVTTFPSTINWGQQLYLTMDVYNGVSWDGQMSPRLPLTSVPSAFALTSPYNTGSYNSSLQVLQPANSVTGNEIFNVQDQGAAGTYSLLTGGSISGATTGVVLQSGTPGTAQVGSFNVNGTGIVGTLQVATSGSIDTSSSGTLSIGTSNATGILLGQNATFANGANRALVIAAASSGVGNQLTIHAGNGASGNTGGNLLLQAGANGTANGTPGSVIVKANGGDSTTAFEVQNAAGASAILNVDTTVDETTLHSSGAAATAGPELITTTNFTNATWTSTGWATTTTTATHSTGNTNGLSTNQFTATAGNTYQVTFTVTGSPTASETITPYIGAVAGQSISGNVTSEVETITAAGTTTPAVSFVPTSNWNGIISAVSVKLLTASNAGLSIQDATSAFTIDFRTSGVFGNTFIGNGSGSFVTTGNRNTGIGSGALFSDTTGQENTASGYNTMEFNTTGNENSAYGRWALQLNVSGSNNTALGYAAGLNNITGSNNTFIGSGTSLGSSTGGQLQNATAIGVNSVVSQNDSLILGCTSGINSCTTTTSVGIGTSAPTATLNVAGTALFQAPTNSTSAFQVQNAASDQILNINTVQSSLVANPSFEGSMGYTNWAGVNTGGLSQNSTFSNVYYGNDSLAIALGGTANSGATTSTYTATLGANHYSLSFMAKGSAALTGLTASLGSGTCTLNSTTVSTSYSWYSCANVTTTGSPVVKITATTTGQTLYIDGVELDQSTTPSAFRSGSTNVQGSLTVNGSQQQAANSQYALTVNELQDSNSSIGGGGLFIQGNSDNFAQNALVVAQLNGNNQLTVNTTDSETSITGGSGPSGWNTPSLSVSTTDGTATALQAINNNLSTGYVANIDSSSATQTAGSLLNVSDTATLAISGSSITGSLANISRSLTSNVTGSSTLTPTLDNGSTFTTSPASTGLTASYTVNSGYSNYYMVIGVMDDDGNNAPTTLTYGGVAATLEQSGGIGVSGSTHGVYIYVLKAPTTGTNNIVLSGGSGEWDVSVEDFYNVNQTTPLGTVPAETKSNVSAPSINITTVSGDVATGFVANTTPTLTATQTRATYAGGVAMTFGSPTGSLGLSYTTAVGTTTTLGWTNTGSSYYWGMEALDLKGASASTESVTSAVASISNSCTITAGSCTDGTNVLQLSQNYSSSTGAVLNIQNSGSGNLINATGSNTAFQIQPNGNLVIADSLSTPTTAIRLRAISSGDNIETAGEDMWLSGWTNANFTGTQLYYARGDLPTGDLFIGNAGLNGTSNANSNYGVTLLVLDASANNLTYNQDPSNAFNGSMYYNTYTNEFRCYQNGEWRNCVSSVESWGDGGFGTASTISSATYADYPNSNTAVTFSKAASTTKLLIHVEVNPWNTVGAAELGLQIKIGSNTYICGEDYYNFPTVTGTWIGPQHLNTSCTVVVTNDTTTGSQTATLQWARVGGTGTLNADTTTWGDMSIQETD
jgi:hypothetical protein